MYDEQIINSNGLSLSAYLAALSRESIERGGAHPDSTQHAARATSRRLKGEFEGRRLSYRDTRRVRAYYLAVLRNAAFERSRPVDREYRERLKVASLVQDLRAANAPEVHIRQEVESFFGQGALDFMLGAAAVS